MEMILNDNATYPFYWLDEVIECTLNPVRADVSSLTTDLLEAVRERLPREIQVITDRLKQQAFSLYQNDQVGVVAGHYDQSVKLLLRQAGANLDLYPGTGLLRETGELILHSLSDLASAMRLRFSAHLPGEGVPPGALPHPLFKMLIRLSGDQAGVLIRAAFEGHLIDSVSLRAAYKALTPFLSTLQRESLSADSLRSNSGRPEHRDLDILVAHLVKLTEIVKGYYRRR